MDYLQYKKKEIEIIKKPADDVLNLVINGLPSIPKSSADIVSPVVMVLNLVINGLPSILEI